MSVVDRALSALPDSTHAWTCPWHWTLVWWGLIALVAGALAHTAVGVFAAVVGIGLLVLTFAQRRTGDQSCKR